MKTKLLYIFLGLFCLVSIGISVYFYFENKKLIVNPQVVVERESLLMLKKIAEVMELPNEKPSIISVVDREKLQDQEFFKKAVNGDKILVYEGARRIILFRPSTGKVIDMVPLAFNTPVVQHDETQE